MIPNNALYDTTEYKIIEITDIVTNQNLTEYNKFKLYEIYTKNIYYFLTYKTAFYYNFANIDGLYFENGYTGKINSYATNGILKIEYYLINNKKEGQLQEYNNDKLISIFNYVDGIKNGNHIEYYDNG